MRSCGCRACPCVHRWHPYSVACNHRQSWTALKFSCQRWVIQPLPVGFGQPATEEAQPWSQSVVVASSTNRHAFCSKHFAGTNQPCFSRGTLELFSAQTRRKLILVQSCRSSKNSANQFGRPSVQSAALSGASTRSPPSTGRTSPARVLLLSTGSWSELQEAWSRNFWGAIPTWYELRVLRRRRALNYKVDVIIIWPIFIWLTFLNPSKIVYFTEDSQTISEPIN